MEKKKSDICLEVLKRFSEAGILKDIILIGSWCLYFYKDYFTGVYVPPLLRTRDVDFLVPLPTKMKKGVNVPALLKDMGFVVEHLGSEGYLRMGHPELMVEFLVPERGRGSNRPFPLPQISMNAQPLRYLDFLAKHVIEITAEGLRIKLPHPAAYALHKLVILGRRRKADKAAKDREQALWLLHFVLNNGGTKQMKQIFLSMPIKWRKVVLDNLKIFEENELIEAVSSK